MNVKRSALNAAILMVVNGGAQAAFNNGAVTSMTIQDVGSGGLNAYSPVLDNHSGHMHFGKINDATYGAGSPFTSDVGPINTASAMSAGSFSNGFLFSGSPFVPLTQGPIVANISYAAGSPEPLLTIASLPWAGQFSGTTFVLPPQAYADWLATCGGNPGNPWLPIKVYWVGQINATQVKYKIGWSHCITSAEDHLPLKPYATFNANWRLEGVATFSTAADASPPAVFSVLPANGSTVAVVTSDVVVTYDEPMNPATVIASSITVGGASVVTLGTPVASGNNTVFTFPITSGILVSGGYAITFNTGPKDVAGNNFTPTGPYTFVAGVDTTPPIVASTTPANAATDVATNTNRIVVTFNEPMKLSTVVAGSVNVSGGVTVGAPIASNGNTVFTFPITSGPLTDGVTYTITIAGPTDISSNAVATTTSSFQTPSVVAPRVPTPIGSLGGGGCASNPAAPFNSSLLAVVVSSLGYLGWRRKKSKS